MATINKVIEKAARIRPDAFDDAVKASWISELDGKIMRETMHGEQSVSYKFPNQADDELLVKAPYDNIYELYIVAMSDFYSGDFASYSASSAMFENAYEEFKKDYIRHNMPVQQKLKY